MAQSIRLRSEDCSGDGDEGAEVWQAAAAGSDGSFRQDQQA